MTRVSCLLAIDLLLEVTASRRQRHETRSARCRRDRTTKRDRDSEPRISMDISFPGDVRDITLPSDDSIASLLALRQELAPCSGVGTCWAVPVEAAARTS